MSDKNLKILFAIGGLRAGGAEKVCVALLNEFFNQGFDVSLVVLNTEKAEFLKYVSSGVPIYDLKIAHARSSMFPLRRLLKDLKITICLSFNFQLSVQFVLLKRIFGFRYILFSRGINTFSEKISKESSFRHKYLNAFLIKQFYRKSDYFIAQSTGMKEDMMRSLNIEENKIQIIFNPVFSFKESSSESSSPNNESDLKEILFVGSLKEQKNIPFLLNSIKELIKKRTDFVFRIVGEGKERRMLEELSYSLGLDKYVKFEGFSNNASSYYRVADVFILGSWYEGFPNVIIEALSKDVPVVSVDCKSGPSDIIEPGINGFLVKDYDTQEFALKISEVLDRKWNKEALLKSINKFSFYSIFNQYKEYLLHEEKN